MLARSAIGLRSQALGVLMAHVLFVCRQNAGRSQMSEALFGLPPDAGGAGGGHTAESAGTTPADAVHPLVVQAMAEVGIDLRGRHPAPLTDEAARRADMVVTMGCGDQCPYVPGTRYVDWQLPDPAGMGLDEVRALREEIRGCVEALVGELSVPDSSARQPRSA